LSFILHYIVPSIRLAIGYGGWLADGLWASKQAPALRAAGNLA
jgi:hypothetical protein